VGQVLCENYNSHVHNLPISSLDYYISIQKLSSGVIQGNGDPLQA
jgi:hypothetical protein